MVTTNELLFVFRNLSWQKCKVLDLQPNRIRAKALHQHFMTFLDQVLKTFAARLSLISVSFGGLEDTDHSFWAHDLCVFCIVVGLEVPIGREWPPKPPRNEVPGLQCNYWAIQIQLVQQTSIKHGVER